MTEQELILALKQAVKTGSIETVGQIVYRLEQLFGEVNEGDEICAVVYDEGEAYRVADLWYPWNEYTVGDS